MPTRTRKRKASEEDDATPEVIPAAKKTLRTSQRGSQGQPSKAKASSKNGRSRTTGNLNPVRASKSSKSTTFSVSNAKRGIRRKADELIHVMETQVEDWPSNLGSGPTATEPKTTPHRKAVIDLEHDSIRRTLNAIYQKSCEHLQSLQKTIVEYKRFNHAAANFIKPADTKQWEQDFKDIAQVNKRALNIATDTLHDIVLGEKNINSHRSPAPPVDGEVDQAARRWLQTGVPIRGDTWGDTAREILNALSGIAKILS